MAKYRLGINDSLKDTQGNLTGSHRIGNVRYVRGDIVESDEPLDKLFRGKFVKVSEGVPVSEGTHLKRSGKINLRPARAAVAARAGEATVDSPASPLQEQVDRLMESQAKSVKAAKKSPYGTDVTTDFPNAEMLDMKVFNKTNAQKPYTVVDVASGEVLKQSKSKMLVKKFLDKQLG